MTGPDNIERVVFAEGWESLLVVLAIMILSGLGNLIKKFQGKSDDTSWEDESQPAPSKPAQSSWEDQLRGLLEQKQNPVAPPLLAPITYKPAPLRTYARDEEEPSQRPLVHLTQSATAYERAAMLHERVAAHLQQVDKRMGLHRPAAPVMHIRKRSLEAEAVVSLLRKPTTARQAIIASIILGTPKSLET